MDSPLDPATICSVQNHESEAGGGELALSWTLVSLLTGSVTISRQQTRMLCCLVRTLLSPALHNHHGRA